MGAHLNLTRNQNGATLTSRFRKAIKMTKHLKWMAIGGQMKERIVLCNILPAALYGVEASHVSISALNALRSAIADVVGPNSRKKNVNFVFDCI